MANYLITGGAGFIGHHIANRLLREGHNVVITDNFRTGKPENIPKKSTFVEIDIRFKNELDKIPNIKFDAVLHLAAQSSGEISHDDPAYDFDTNAKGTLNLLQWSTEREIVRFLNASTMGVYGEVSIENNPVHEEMFLKPLSFYGVTKNAAENYCNYFISKGMKITSFRIFNVYGPGQNLENLKQGMISIYMAYILGNKPVEIKGSLNRFRDLIYIDDVVEAWITSLNNPASYGKVYNLGTGVKTHVYELIENLLLAFGEDCKKYPVKKLDPTPGDQSGIYANIEKIKADLNWEPRISLKEGLLHLTRFYANNRIK